MAQKHDQVEENKLDDGKVENKIDDRQKVTIYLKSGQSIEFIGYYKSNNALDELTKGYKKYLQHNDEAISYSGIIPDMDGMKAKFTQIQVRFDEIAAIQYAN